AVGFSSVMVLTSVVDLGLAGFLLPLAATLMSLGVAMPNAPAIALTRHGEAAGTTAALLGAARFVIGAAAAPLVGVLGNDAIALSTVVAVSLAVALGALLLLAPRVAMGPPPD